MDKSELRVKLLEGMCKCAEEISLLYESGGGTAIYFDEPFCPEAFKPGVADKAMFNRIIDKVINNIEDEEKNGKGLPNADYMGVALMMKFYYPQYGNWRKMPSHKELLKRLILRRG